MPQEQLGFAYAAGIRLSRNQFEVEGGQVRLSVGMNVTAEIKTGHR